MKTTKSLSILVVLAFFLTSTSLFAQKTLRLADLQPGDLSHDKLNLSYMGNEIRSKGLFLYGVGIGYNLKSLRFDTKYDFEKVDGELLLIDEANPAYEYPDRVFRNGFSGLTGHYIRIAPMVGFGKEKRVYATTGPTIDIRFASVQQHKYFVDDTRNRDYVYGNDLLQLRTFNLGWRIGVNVLNAFSVYYEVAAVNFLRDDWNSDIKFNGISFALEM